MNLYCFLLALDKGPAEEPYVKKKWSYTTHENFYTEFPQYKLSFETISGEEGLLKHTYTYHPITLDFESKPSGSNICKNQVKSKKQLMIETRNKIFHLVKLIVLQQYKQAHLLLLETNENNKRWTEDLLTKNSLKY